jgi:hypothetical protein
VLAFWSARPGEMSHPIHGSIAVARHGRTRALRARASPRVLAPPGKDEEMRRIGAAAQTSGELSLFWS